MKAKYAEIEIAYKGRTMTLKEWAEFLGLDYDTLRMRHVRGATGWKLFAPTERGKRKMRCLIRELG